MVRINFIKSLSVRGSSLIEVITAMIIIGIVFAASVVIYLNVIGSSFVSLKSVAKFHLQEVITKSELEKNYISAEFEFEGVRVFQEVESRPDQPGVKIITWEARNTEGKVLAIRRKMKYGNQ